MPNGIDETDVHLSEDYSDHIIVSDINDSDINADHFTVSNDSVSTLCSSSSNECVPVNLQYDPLANVNRHNALVQSITNGPTSCIIDDSITANLVYDVFKTSDLKCLHINVHSIFPKIHEIARLVQSNNIDCISINETFLDHSINDCEIAIDSYSIFRHDRNRHGGGVLLYIKQCLSPSLIESSSHIEAIWVKIKCKRNRKFIIGSMYRPPNSNTNYHEHILRVFERIFAYNCNLIIMGDFNYNALCSIEYKKVADLETYFQLSQVIDKPTRVTQTTRSLIDHIYVSNHLSPTKSGTLAISLSDHFPVFAILPIKCPQAEQRKVEKRFRFRL